MDIKDIRRINLQKLIDEMFDGVAARLAAKLDMKTPQLHRWRSGGQGMREDSARGIERTLSLPPLTLDRLITEPLNVGPGPDLRGTVPLISWVQAGEFSEAIDLLAPGEGDQIKVTITPRAHTFALRVQGDSMEPDFPAGTVVVVEPEFDALPGDYIIAKFGDEATFKQLVKDSGDLYLKPLNPRYPIKPLGSASIIGVVREAIRKFR